MTFHTNKFEFLQRLEPCDIILIIAYIKTFNIASLNTTKVRPNPNSVYLCGDSYKC